MDTKIDIRLQTKITLELEENKARALHTLTRYGFNNFIKCFYEHLGEAYLKPYNNSLRAIFDELSEKIPPLFNQLEEFQNKINNK